LKNAHYRINEPSVIHQVFDDELVAINLSSGAYHALPGLAGEVLLMLGSGGVSIEALVAEIASHYGVASEVVERDLRLFFEQLVTQSIVVPAEPGSTAAPPPCLPAREHRAPYSAPRVESYDDLMGLVLLDPVHDVGAAGWPHTAPVSGRSEAEEQGFSLMRCRIAGPNVIFERFDNETVVMNLGTGTYHSLTGPAEDIFLLLPQEPTTWEIRDALARKYTVSEAELEEALRHYLGQLAAGGLIAQDVVGEETPGRILDLGPAEGSAEFVAPVLETYAQPTFDTPPMAVETAAPGSEPSGAGAGAAAGFDPFSPRRYGLRSSELFYSTASAEIVAADREFGLYLKLNEPASDVFRLLSRGTDVLELMTFLEKKYAASGHSLRASLILLLYNLRKLRLIRDASGDEQPRNGAGPAEGTESRVAFPGFDVIVYRDLADLMIAFNAAPAILPRPNLVHARQFLQLLETYFHEAADAGGISEGRYSIADRGVRIRCAGGGRSSELLRAFSHLRGDSGGEELTIHAWTRGSGAPGPLLEMALSRFYDTWPEMCGPRGEFLGMHGGPISAIYHPGPDTLSLVDLESGKAFYLGRDEEPLPFWELSSPFRHILHPWFASRGLQYTHAGAVGGANGGVLLAGKGGSGKSTTTLLCASAGMLYAGDDYCLTDAATGCVYSLYNTAKLKGLEDLERVPVLRERSYNADSFEQGGLGKGTFCLSDLWPERMTARLPLRAIVLPVVTGGRDSSLEPCAVSDALLALTPSTVAQLPQAALADCDRLAALAEKVPAFHLYLGSDLDQIPRLLEELVA
jgi:hypothetical protein